MAKKYFTLSFDDGIEQDKRLTALMRQYGIKGTFNLNSGLLGKKSWIKRLGNYSVGETTSSEKGILPKVESFRMTEDELLETYEGFEVASHSLTHQSLKALSKSEMEKEVNEDIANLERLFGQSIRGFAYPYGRQSAETEKVLRKSGILYARGVMSAKNFDFPANPLKWKPSAWIIEKKAIAKLEEFLRIESEKDQLFCLWGHGYELDYETSESSWAKIETIFKMVSGRSDIILATNREVFKSRGYSFRI